MSALVRRAYPWLRKPVRFIARALLSPKTRNRLKAAWLPREFNYDAEYFLRDIDGPATVSAPIISGSILRDFAPKSVIDIGCGTGALLAQLRNQGCTVIGLEYAAPARDMCKNRGLEVRAFDITQDSYEAPRPYDVVVSMEVAEHLPESSADRYVELLSRLGHNIVFTAATPGQGGTDHVNEQPHEYWINKFAQRDRILDWTLTSRWRAAWRDSGNVQSWYYNNLLVFRAPRKAESFNRAPQRETV